MGKKREERERRRRNWQEKRSLKSCMSPPSQFRTFTFMIKLQRGTAVALLKPKSKSMSSSWIERVVILSQVSLPTFFSRLSSARSVIHQDSRKAVVVGRDDGLVVFTSCVCVCTLHYGRRHGCFILGASLAPASTQDTLTGNYGKAYRSHRFLALGTQQRRQFEQWALFDKWLRPSLFIRTLQVRRRSGKEGPPSAA